MGSYTTLVNRRLLTFGRERERDDILLVKETSVREELTMKGPALLSLPGRIAEIRQEETVLIIEVFSEQTRGQCPVCLRGVRLSP